MFCYCNQVVSATIRIINKSTCVQRLFILKRNDQVKITEKSTTVYVTLWTFDSRRNQRLLNVAKTDTHLSFVVGLPSSSMLFSHLVEYEGHGLSTVKCRHCPGPSCPIIEYLYFRFDPVVWACHQQPQPAAPLAAERENSPSQTSCFTRLPIFEKRVKNTVAWGLSLGVPRVGRDKTMTLCCQLMVFRFIVANTIQWEVGNCLVNTVITNDFFRLGIECPMLKICEWKKAIRKNHELRLTLPSISANHGPKVSYSYSYRVVLCSFRGSG